MTCLRHDEKTAKQQETDSSNFPLPTNHSSLWFDRLANHSLLLTSLLEKDIPLKKIITRKTSSELQNFGDFFIVDLLRRLGIAVAKYAYIRGAELFGELYIVGNLRDVLLGSA